MATAPERKIDFGRVLSSAFQTLLKNAVPFLGVSLVLGGIPGFVFQYWMLGMAAGAQPSVEFMFSAQFWAPILASIIIGIISSALLQGTLVGATVRHLTGRPVDIGQSVAAALSRILLILLLSILIGLVVLLGTLLLIVPGIILYLMYSVSVPVMMAEGRGVTDSMSRSSSLTQGSKLMIFLLLIVVGMISGAVSGFGNAIFAQLAGVPGSEAYRITLSLGAMVNETITTAIGAVLIAALYVELRTVKEGASTEVLADVFS